MNMRLIFAFEVLFLVIIYGGCSAGNEKSDTRERVYAKVNGARLTESDMKALVPGDVYDKMTEMHKSEVVKGWAKNEVLYQEALRRNIDKDPMIARILENSKRNLLVNELLERIFADIKAPSDDELKDYYNKRKDYFVLPDNEYKIRYALFDSREIVDDFWKKVKLGSSFSDLAQKMSKDPSFQNGGDLGIVSEEMIEPEVWKAIIVTYKKLGIVKISDPFSVSGGWACLIIDEIYEQGSVKPFEAVRDQVREMYIVEKREEVKNEFIEQLSQKAKITYESVK
ncbi:peptidyl-prolyl cis-trans isomerase [bacterium]|nr:peptidyl-prolyl cis-trans isomerase [bacterium]